MPGRDVPSPLLQASFGKFKTLFKVEVYIVCYIDYKEFIFTYLQKFASSRRSFIGPLTEKAASDLAKFTDKMIDSALSQDDITIRKAVDQLIGTVESSDIVLGELLDERKWDIAEEAVEDCLDFITSKVAQHVDFYADAPEAARADPVFSMILAETDWLLYEMVSYVADEPVDKQLYDDHFYGPSEEEKLKRKQLELQMKKKLNEKRQQSFYPAISSAFLQPTKTEQSFAPPPDLEGLDPNTAAYWQAYQDCQQQAAFLQQAAYSYSAKQHAHYIFSQAQASTSAYNSYVATQTQAQATISASNPPQNKPKSLAAKFIQSALNAKKASMGNSSPKAAGPSVASPKQPEPKVNSPKPDETKRSEKSSRTREESSRKRDRDESDRDEKLPGPIYCMVTNLRYDTRASDVDRSASRYGRVDSIKVLKDKTAKPPENGLASITFRYVYKSSFERLLSNGLRVDGKYRPIAKLQSDPFGSS